MSKLVTAGERLAALKAQKDALIAQAYESAADLIAEFEDSISEEWEQQLLVIQESLKSSEPTVKDQARTLLREYKRDKRNEHNTLKGINIGVTRSFEHKRKANEPPRRAKRLVIEAMIKIAKEKGGHSRQCSCGGVTDGCRLTRFRVHDEDSLPLPVIAKIEEWAQKYKDAWTGEEEEAALSA